MMRASIGLKPSGFRACITTLHPMHCSTCHLSTLWIQLNPFLAFPLGDSRLACATASLATGTLGEEHDT